MWHFIKTETNRKGKKTVIFFNSVNVKICDCQDISDSFKNFFHSIANKINLNIKIVIVIINIKIQITYIIYQNYLLIHYHI